MNNEFNLHFELVNNRNRREIKELKIRSTQEHFIESVEKCLEEADELAIWCPVGIYDGDTLVGFAMYGYFSEPAPGQLWLDRLLIDKKYQGKGYGKQAVLALLDKLHAEYPSDVIYLSVYPNNMPAIQLYQTVGFHFNGEQDKNGESIMVYVPKEHKNQKS